MADYYNIRAFPGSVFPVILATASVGGGMSLTILCSSSILDAIFILNLRRKMLLMFSRGILLLLFIIIIIIASVWSYAFWSSCSGCPSSERNMSCVLFNERNIKVWTECFTTGMSSTLAAILNRHSLIVNRLDELLFLKLIIKFLFIIHNCLNSVLSSVLILQSLNLQSIASKSTTSIISLWW